MSCWAVIPIKAPAEGKTRLAEALDTDTRAALVRAMLKNVVQAAEGATGIARTVLVGPSRHGLPDTMPLLADAGQGLNAALTAALQEVAEMGASRAIFVAADLPTVSAAELDVLALAPEQSIAIAPDRHGTGTNAISLPLPAARGFSFRFGPDSLARHRNEAERLGLGIEMVHSHGLAHDIDEPCDLPDAAGLLE